jgi:hypothetical protein
MPIGGRGLLCPYYGARGAARFGQLARLAWGTVRGWRSQRWRSVVLNVPSGLPTGVDRKTTGSPYKSTPSANFRQAIV